MQVTISETEIHSAVRAYIIKRLRLEPTESVSVELLATRGAGGFTAVLTIEECDLTEPPTKPTFTPSKERPSESTPTAVKSVVIEVPEPTKKVVVPEVVAPVIVRVEEEAPVVLRNASGLFAHLTTS